MLVKTKTCALSQILEKSWNMITLIMQQPHLPKKLTWNRQNMLLSLEKLLVIPLEILPIFKMKAKVIPKKRRQVESAIVIKMTMMEKIVTMNHHSY